MTAATVTLPEAAELLGISRDHAYQLVRRDEFPCRVIRLGRRVVVPTAELDRLLAADASTPSDPTPEAGERAGGVNGSADGTTQSPSVPPPSADPLLRGGAP